VSLNFLVGKMFGREDDSHADDDNNGDFLEIML